MDRLTAREIEPRGWLKRQLKIQAEGLSGNLDKIWPDIKESKWIGGMREGWERVPYWLDGFIPLAYLLKDEDMISRAERYIGRILKGQDEDGWSCPCTQEERKSYDMWALFLILKVLVTYYECSGDERIEEAVYRALWQYPAQPHAASYHSPKLPKYYLKSQRLPYSPAYRNRENKRLRRCGLRLRHTILPSGHLHW